MSPPASATKASATKTPGTEPQAAQPLTPAQRSNSRLGLWLCGVYTLPYAGFVLVSAFAPDLIKWKPYAGLNLAVWWGLALIGLACLLAFAYGLTCKSDLGE